MPRWIWIVVVAYFLGAIPTGAVVARAYGVDLTQYGSRRTGATNALRVLGKRAAAIVLVGDVLKGLLAVSLARSLAGGGWAPPLAGLTAMAGHTYSVFLGFRGGRGVATGLGALLALAPRALLTAALVAVGTIGLTRYVSLGSLVGAVAGCLALSHEVRAGRAPRPYLAFAWLGAAFVIYAHRDNVGRLLAGSEHKLGQSVAPDVGHQAAA